MMPIEHIQEFRSAGAWNVSFCVQFLCGLTKWPNTWPADQGPSNGAVISYDAGFSKPSSCPFVTS